MNAIQKLKRSIEDGVCIRSHLKQHDENSIDLESVIYLNNERIYHPEKSLPDEIRLPNVCERVFTSMFYKLANGSETVRNMAEAKRKLFSDPQYRADIHQKLEEMSTYLEIGPQY